MLLPSCIIQNNLMSTQSTTHKTSQQVWQSILHLNSSTRRLVDSLSLIIDIHRAIPNYADYSTAAPALAVLPNNSSPNVYAHPPRQDT